MKVISSVLLAIAMFFGIAPAICEAEIPQELPKIEYYGAYYSLSYNEFEAICNAVMAEAEGESFEGQQAVAQCILNTCEIKGIAPLEAITKYQYASTNRTPSDSVREAVTSVFTDGAKVIDERVTLFYSPANMKNGISSYHESQIYSCTIGGHKFFIERENY